MNNQQILIIIGYKVEIVLGILETCLLSGLLWSTVNICVENSGTEIHEGCACIVIPEAHMGFNTH